jgi:hypothetical protein
MLQCKSCGKVFAGLYVSEGITEDFKTMLQKLVLLIHALEGTPMNMFLLIIWIGLDIHWRI